ncbi:MAG: hypothetical protein Q4B60_08500 [Erysipelotrichaceae bacterium]|nr:hypothetical protein [Erysipelotrichaceae bacterium]
MFGFKSKKKENLNVVDIHCHILPGIDDGSKDMKESLEMLRIAEKEGITDIILTPHHKEQMGGLNSEEVNKLFAELQAEKDANNIKVNLYLGSELMYSSSLIINGELNDLRLNNSNFLLMEFNPSISFTKLRTALVNLTRTGSNIILAHAERYMCLVDNFDYVEDLIDCDILFQVNANSVINKDNKKMYNFVHKLLKNEYVDFVATDAHSSQFRAPEIADCAKVLYKKYDHEYVDEILYLNAYRYLGVNSGEQ